MTSLRGLPVLLGVLAALFSAAGASARPLTEPTPAGSDWLASATSMRGQSGTRAVYICPASGPASQIWGTDTYTDDSSVCTAAVQQGLITIAEGGTVTIEHLAGQASYTGSTRNGITSASWASWGGSFRVVAATRGGGAAGVKMGGGSWTASATSFRGRNGSRYSYVCPAGGLIGTVWGTNTYTDDSSVCTAAVQVGLITAAAGGVVTIEIRPGQSSYAGFTHNGVTTRSYTSWFGSFVFAGAAQIPGSPGGGGGGGGVPPATPPKKSGPTPPATATATGTVLVNGKPFTGGIIPYNSTVDVTSGAVKLTTDTGSVTLNGANGITAAFRLVHATLNKKPIVELFLAKGDFTVCPKRTTKSARAATTTTVRELWGNGKGSFQTRGKYAAATVRGTNWLTADRCDGTLTSVKRGVVSVTDLVLHRQVTVRAGQSYLAKG